MVKDLTRTGSGLYGRYLKSEYLYLLGQYWAVISQYIYIKSAYVSLSVSLSTSLPMSACQWLAYLSVF